MKVRKLAVALALAGGLGSGVAQALGLGEVELQSFLNEPLDADIRLLKTEGVSPDEVFVELASQQSYERLGLTRDFFLSNLRFEVVTAPNGGLMVSVTSREPVREPYLNFLLEVTWPSGRLMREYAVLVDPPVYAEESGLREQVQAPSASAGRPEQSSRQQAAPRAPTQQPLRQTNSSSSRISADNTFGPISASDTLWGIATAVRPNDSLSPQQVMLALQDLNPDAFIDNNINKLKRGEVLRIPSLDQIQTRTRAEAVRQVTAQNEALTRPVREVDGTDQAPQVAATGSAADPGGDELRLIVPGDSPRTSEDGASAGSDGSRTGGSEADRAAALETLDESRRENEELTTRVDDLQSQVETLQRLIELKDSQLADLQAMAQAANAGDNGSDNPERVAGDGSISEVAADDVTAVNQSVSEAIPSENGADTDVDNATDTVAESTTETDSGAEVAAGLDGQERPEAVDEVAQGDSAETARADQPASGDAVDGNEAVADAEPDLTTAAPAEPAEQKPAVVSPVEPVADKGLIGNTIDAITNNPLYQIALGGGLVLLLLLLLLLARRNANREKAFYEQLNNDSEDDSEGFDLTLDEQDDAGEPQGDSDPIADADVYIAYGRLDQAAHTLETAISREPSRTDLRLKLLAVYADSNDRGAFEKQFIDLETLDDEQAIEEASALRPRLDEAETMPSIDDLESQLRSEAHDFEVSPDENKEEVAYSFNEAPEVEPSDNQFATSFENLDLEDELNNASESEEVEKTEKPVEYDISDLGKPSVDDALQTDSAAQDGLTDSELDELSLDFETDNKPTTSDVSDDDLEDEFASLDLDDDGGIDRLAEEDEDELPSLEDDELTTSEDGSLDESFLDELDAELEKVAGEDSDEEALDSDESLDDLELDISDEDLALMEEVADNGEYSNSVPPLENELDAEDEAPLVEPDADQSEDRLPAGSAASASRDFDESDLGEDDDFDFLTGTDEAGTKLDLARAYIEMGDSDGARDILEEVSIEGSNEQKTEAEDLLKNLA